MCSKTKALEITLLCGRASEYRDHGSLFDEKIQGASDVYEK